MLQAKTKEILKAENSEITPLLNELVEMIDEQIGDADEDLDISALIASATQDLSVAQLIILQQKIASTDNLKSYPFAMIHNSISVVIETQKRYSDFYKNFKILY